MKLLPGRILLMLLALTVGIALGAGLVGAFRTPAPPSIEPIQLEGDSGDESGEGGTKQSGIKNTKNGDKPANNDAPPPQNEAPDDNVAPPPPPPPPPADDDDDDDDGGDTDDDGGDD